MDPEDDFDGIDPMIDHDAIGRAAEDFKRKIKAGFSEASSAIREAGLDPIEALELALAPLQEFVRERERELSEIWKQERQGRRNRPKEAEQRKLVRDYDNARKGQRTAVLEEYAKKHCVTMEAAKQIIIRHRSRMREIAKKFGLEYEPGTKRRHLLG